MSHTADTILLGIIVVLALVPFYVLFYNIWNELKNVCNKLTGILTELKYLEKAYHEYNE